MPKKNKTSRKFEPWIVAQDDDSGMFELVYWAETEEEAEEFYQGLLDKYEFPTKDDKNLHIFRLATSTDPVYLEGLKTLPSILYTERRTTQ